MDDNDKLAAAEHRAAEELLPWYVTGRLDETERARVDAHLVHCAACKGELAVERRLAAAVAATPIGEDLHWARFQSMLSSTPPPRRSIERRWATVRRVASRPGKMGWFVAAQAAVLLIVVQVAPQPGVPRSGDYATLGASEERRAGDILVMFAPEATERDVRRAVTMAGGRLVDGPTVTGAYVLSVKGGRRAAAVALLRSVPRVSMAEPVGRANEL